MGDGRNAQPDLWDLILDQRESMMRVALARSSNRHDAEDLVQEAMLRAAQMANVRQGSVGPLVRTIVMNLAADQHRRLCTSLRYEARLSADDRITTPVEEAVCDRSEAMWLYAQVVATGGRDQEVLLHRAAGHSVRSAGDRLGMSYKAVESAFTRARTHARLAWQATLGVVLAMAAALRRTLKPVTAGAIATTALAASLLTLEAISPPSHDAVSAGGYASAEFTHAVTTSKRRNPAAAPIRKDNLRALSAPTSRPRPTPVLDTGTIGSRDLVETGVSVQDEHQNETLAETLERCLRQGAVVSPTNIECRDDVPTAPDRATVIPAT